MKTLLRGFLAGFGFALGASVAGTLIGYTIGRASEAGVKLLLSRSATSDPGSSSSPASSTPTDLDDGTMWQGCTECGVPHSSNSPHVTCDCDCGAGTKYGYADRSKHDPDCEWRIRWVESWRGAPARPDDWSGEAARETMHTPWRRVTPIRSPMKWPADATSTDLDDGAMSCCPAKDDGHNGWCTHSADASLVEDDFERRAGD